MSRPLRIEFADALYHITSRGDRREAIYEDDEDREAFLAVLAQVVDRYHWICLAYCLMTNHCAIDSRQCKVLAFVTPTRQTANIPLSSIFIQ